MYALYAWGNPIYEGEFERHPDWLAPELLRGERRVLSEYLCLTDAGPLPVDGANTLFEVDDEVLPGRELLGRDLTGAEWEVFMIRIATDGSLEDAMRVAQEFSEHHDVHVDESPEEDTAGVGELLTTWEDQSGQWDLALYRV